MGKSTLIMNVMKRQASTNMTAEEFWNDLQHVFNEVEHALKVYYTFEEINTLGVKSAAAFSAFNNDAMFWTTQTYSLQTALFMTISRIFDTNENAMSIHRILNAMLGHPELFSKETFALRKSTLDIERHFIDELVAGAWAPNGSADLRYLKKALKPHAKRFREIYQPIRNEHYGHRLTNTEKTILELFALTNRVELAQILDFLHDLVAAIEQLYLNGIQPELGTRSFENHNEKIRASARSVVRKAAGRELFPRGSELEP
jgi:hypothetical protein